ncbi:hypothetical protein IMZ29_00755 [Achromobacter sp. GG226]|uniref:hypothetical protein n=1 Tax=Verticiella alkaliphila TaxID=2779529 RepID=UPI001C0C388A|nr:hypothetical protein [Verticiella sp. GG226]MBU4609132.1 hypothetical protein [Verticiella sp. GG226]
MSLPTLADAKIFIGRQVENQSDDLVAADFTGATWIEIGYMTNIGQYGDTQNVIEQEILGRGRVLKGKGISNAGTLENTMIPVPTDPGQIALKAAQASRCNYEWKIEYPGEECGEGEDTTQTDMFHGLALPGARQGGGASAVSLRNWSVGINSNIVET